MPTLWSAAAARDLKTASVNWSVTVANRDIDYLIPEFWRAVNDEDVKLLRALSRPEGLLERLEAELGPFVNGYDDYVPADVVRTRFAAAMLREQRPDLMAVHLIALDGTEHRDGPWVPSAHRTLEAIDAMVGELAGGSAGERSRYRDRRRVGPWLHRDAHGRESARAVRRRRASSSSRPSRPSASRRRSPTGKPNSGPPAARPPSCCATAATRRCGRASPSCSTSCAPSPPTASRGCSRDAEIERSGRVPERRLRRRVRARLLRGHGAARRAPDAARRRRARTATCPSAPRCTPPSL